MDGVKLFCGNCIDLMNDIPDGTIDLVITDPPYKLNKTTGSTTSSSKAERWQGNILAADKTAGIMNEISFSDWLPILYKKLKDSSHCYIWTNDKNICDLQTEAEKVGFQLHNVLIWKKNNCTPNRWYMKNCEFVLFLRKGKSFPIANLGDSQLFEVNNISGKSKLHPTQKPVEVLERLVINSSAENGIVFDPFMGSGSTGVACVRTGRRFIGMELDKQYFDIAEKRIDRAKGCVCALR